MSPVLLLTDLAILALCLLVLTNLVLVLNRPLLRQKWASVFKRPAAMAAGIVMVFFLLIGLIDSVHMRSGDGQVVSALDLMLAPLHEQEERTYSAPLAIHGFVRETVRSADGTVSREFPRLEYAGDHLHEGQGRTRDIVGRMMSAALFAVSVLAVLTLLAVLRLAADSRDWAAGLRALSRGGTEWPLRTALLTLSGLAGLVSLMPLLAFDYHLLGTDKIGQDVLYQTLKSIRTGLVIGTLTTLVMLPFALALGISAGYFGGWIDDVIQYLYTTLNSIPGVLLIAAAVLSLQVFMHTHADWFDSLEARADARLLALCLVLGMTSWTGLARLVRAETLKLREVDFVRSAQALGVRSRRILSRHILPNLMHIVLISVVLDFSVLVLAEAVLSYVGVGVDPSTHSWGNMINGARLEMAREPMVWWSLVGAFSLMFTLVLAVNLFADGVRDAFDPRAHLKP